MKRSLQFIIVTCLFSWLVAGVAIALGLRAQGVAYIVFAALYMLLPAISTLILQLLHKEKIFNGLRVSFHFNPWFLIAGFIPVLYTFLTLLINILLPGISFSETGEGLYSRLSADQAEEFAKMTEHFSPFIFLLIQLMGGIVAAYTINAFFALGEELAWRGYLLRELKHKKLIPVSLITGTVWGLWHFPLILIGHNYPQHPIAGVGMMVVFCILLSPMMTYIVIKSKSVLTAAIFHGSNNAIGGLALLYVSGGNDLSNGVTGLSGFIALLLLNCLFFLYDKYISKENIFSRSIEDLMP